MALEMFLAEFFCENLTKNRKTYQLGSEYYRGLLHTFPAMGCQSLLEIWVHFEA